MGHEVCDWGRSYWLKLRKGLMEGLHALRLGGVPSCAGVIVVLVISSPVVASWVLFGSEAISRRGLYTLEQ